MRSFFEESKRRNVFRVAIFCYWIRLGLWRVFLYLGFMPSAQLMPYQSAASGRREKSRRAYNASMYFFSLISPAWITSSAAPPPPS